MTNLMTAKFLCWVCVWVCEVVLRANCFAVESFVEYSKHTQLEQANKNNRFIANKPSIQKKKKKRTNKMNECWMNHITQIIVCKITTQLKVELQWVLQIILFFCHCCDFFLKSVWQYMCLLTNKRKWKKKTKTKKVEEAQRTNLWEMC